MLPVRIADNLTLRAEEQLAAAEAALVSAVSVEAREQAEAGRAKAVARIAELRAQSAVAKAELQPKLDAIAPARAAAVAAEAARAAAAQAAREVALDLEPVSVFVSRKTQRLYVRRAFEPVLESEVTILDPDDPIGTHVFTAMERSDGDALRWTVVSLAESPDRARAALERIVIPPDALDRIAAMVSPRSSLIVSDEGLSAETGNGTDFVVILSGEPQGSMKIRRRGSGAEARYERPRDRLPNWRPPVMGPSSTW
jgi:hypothetical protein